MRVIGGLARGRPLIVPKASTTRPTSDLVRGAIFSMLEARGAWFTRVLDLYAGSGALGIEALSRGADWADFVEHDRDACAAINRNLRQLGLSAQGRVHCANVVRTLPRLSGPYGLMFLDPPYAQTGVERVLAELDLAGLTDGGTTIVYEHGRRTIPPEVCAGMPRVITRVHGSTALSLYYLPESPATEGED